MIFRVDHLYVNHVAHVYIRAVARFSRHRNIQVLTMYDDTWADLGGIVAHMVATSASL